MSELARIDELVRTLGSGPRSLVLVGEAGIGKTTLWSLGVDRCRDAGARVLVARAAEEDQQVPGQGLRDLFDAGFASGAGSTGGAELHRAARDEDVPVLEQARAVLEGLRALARSAPVVLAVDDLPWLDDETRRVLRFALRRLVDEPVTLFATARSWEPGTSAGPPDRVLDRSLDVLEVHGMPVRDLRRVVLDRLPGARLPDAARAGELAHGNPLLAIELGRGSGALVAAESGGSPLAALRRRVARLPEPALALARVLAVGGPAPVQLLGAVSAHAAGPTSQGYVDQDGRLDAALRAALDAGTVTLGEDFVVRFTHPLFATAVLSDLNGLDRQRLHAGLAGAVTDPDARALHLGNAVVDADEAVAAEIEAAAERLGRRGAPRLAAHLFAHSVRLTPPQQVPDQVRRAVGEMKQRAAVGDVPAARRLAGELLEQLEPGPLWAEVVTGLCVIDFVDAERFLRSALEHVPDDDDPAHRLLRGRLLGVLGWLLAIYQGRVHEGLAHAEEALAVGRAHEDDVLVAQAASIVSTASLLTGRRRQQLVDEAIRRGPEVVRSQLVIWPQVLQGRQQLWDGSLLLARQNLEAMYRSAVANGSELQRGYRLCDLAQVAVASGDLELAKRYADEGLETASACRDDRAFAWLAYPYGVVSALRGDVDGAGWSCERLDGWAERAGERPRLAMACYVRGLLAAGQQAWSDALGHLLAGQSLLDDLGIRHPGVVPVLPLAVQVAALAGSATDTERWHRALVERCTDLGSPWAQAQVTAARGVVLLLREDPAATSTLVTAYEEVSSLGYRLDAARTGHLAVAAGLRSGQRRLVLPIAEAVLSTFDDNGVVGWGELARAGAERLRGPGAEELTATEVEVAGLVAAGRRNREIAEQLFVSESTVEAHLTRVYRKLGIRNRAELCRVVRRQGPPTAGRTPGSPSQTC